MAPRKKNETAADLPVNVSAPDLASVEKELDQVKEKYGTLKIEGPADKENYLKAQEGIAVLVKIRTRTDKIRKGIKSWADEVSNKILDTTTPIEQHLKDEVQKVDNAKEAANKAIEKSRVEALVNAGFLLHGYHYQAGSVLVEISKIITMTEEDFNSQIQLGKEKLEAGRKQREEQAASKAKADQELAETNRLIEEKKRELAALSGKVQEFKTPDSQPPVPSAENEQPQVIHAGGGYRGGGNFSAIKTPEPPANNPGPLQQPANNEFVDLYPPDENGTRWYDWGNGRKTEINTNFVNGFNAMRGIVIGILTDPKKQFTRASLIEELKNKQPLK